jgi:phage shock protein A
MRPQAAAAGQPLQRARVCVTCAKHEVALEALTQAVARLRRGAMALRDENAELRAELSRLQQRRGAASR